MADFASIHAMLLHVETICYLVIINCEAVEPVCLACECRQNEMLNGTVVAFLNTNYLLEIVATITSVKL